MSGIGRIGSAGAVNRDTPSSGLEAQERRDTIEEKRNPQVEEAAKMYEKQFLREMVKAMRGTVSYGAMKPSMGESIYRDQLDDQHVESWGELGGIGLADVIYNQVMERYFTSPRGRGLKNQNPSLPLSNRDVLRVVRPKSQTGGDQVPLKVELGPNKDGSPTRLKAPWDSEVLSNVRLDGGKTALTLGHGPGLSSTLVFDGVAGAGLQPGAKVEAGRTVGVLSPEIRSFFWNLRESVWASAKSNQIGE